MHDHASIEKQNVALSSVIAAVFLTGSKLLVGILTNSIGILSEALHSALDLIAAVITYISVRISGKPADTEHQFGHGKVENLSAFIETLLLLVTCIWIIYEASHRLITGRLHLEVNFWSYIVIITSIIVDISRSKALLIAAKKHKSQALEADALHFSTDVWSSLVVLAGLILANFGILAADSIAALIVALIVITIAVRLGKRSVDVLLDRAPENAAELISKIARNMKEIHTFHDIKVRNAGADTFVEISIHLNPKLNIEKAHQISEKLEYGIKCSIDRCSVHVHLEPDDK